MPPVAIFENEVKKDKDDVVTHVSGWVGPEDGVSSPMKAPNGKELTNVSAIDYVHYADYSLQFRQGRLSYWRISIIDSGLISVYESETDGKSAMLLEGMTAAGLLRVAQIINAVMSGAVEYCADRLENQK